MKIAEAKRAAMTGQYGMRRPSWEEFRRLEWRGNRFRVNIRGKGPRPEFTGFTAEEKAAEDWELVKLPTRTADDVAKAMRELLPLTTRGYRLFPLGIGVKVPRDKGWQMIDYSDFDAADWMRKGGLVGVQLAEDDVVMDVDPRNGGDATLDFLLTDVLGISLLDVGLIVRSGRGDGGRHIYFKKPPQVPVVTNVKGFEGIDFKHYGGLVVAPGSLHPETGEMYTTFVNGDPTPMHPALLDFITKPPAPPRTGEGGEVTCEELVGLLGVLKASDFGKGGRYHHEWLDIAMAVHDATNGEAMEEWLDWCATDPQYGDDYRERNRMRWESFEVGAAGGRTYKTLLAAVVRAGHKDVVKRLGVRYDEVANDFEGIEYE